MIGGVAVWAGLQIVNVVASAEDIESNKTAVDKITQYIGVQQTTNKLFENRFDAIDTRNNMIWQFITSRTANGINHISITSEKIEGTEKDVSDTR